MFLMSHPPELVNRPIAIPPQNNVPTRDQAMVPHSDPKKVGSPATGNPGAPNYGSLPTTPLQFPATAVNAGPQRRRFIIFDHSGNLTSFVFSSVAPAKHNSNTKHDLVGPLQAQVGLPSSTSVVDHSSIAGEGFHEEDADEIDALLYSDSDDCENDRSTGQLHRCNIPDGLEEEEVASSGGPSKRRRSWEEEEEEEDEGDASLADTASSSHAKSNGKEETWVGSAMVKRVKRDRIYEAVCVLRGIIPGCKRKVDAMVVLDEAIRYLKSLEFKAKALGIAP